MKRLCLPLLLLALVLGGLTGCSSTTNIIASGIRIELTQIHREPGGAIQVTWRVHNPNVVAYLFSKSSHKVSLDGTLVGTIEDAAPLGVPAGNHADRVAVLKLAGTTANQVIEQAVTRGSASYRVDSTMWVLITDEEIEKIPLSNSGSVGVIAK